MHIYYISFHTLKIHTLLLCFKYLGTALEYVRNIPEVLIRKKYVILVPPRFKK